MAHGNNFTLLRIFAATLVVWAHAHDLTGSNVPDLFSRLTGKSFGWAAVAMFFAISGYLITRSLTRTPDLRRFAAARALRIFPGLVVCIVVTVLCLGLFVTNLPAARFFVDTETVHYILGNATLLDLQYELPGVFGGNPYPAAVNGSLWTLPKEVGCYIAAAGLFFIGNRKIVLGVLWGAFAAWFFHAAAEKPAITLAFAFLLGATYATFPIVLRWRHVAAATALAAVAMPMRLETPALIVAIAAFTFWFAFARTPRITAISVRMPDWSYGVYIYAFPVQQTVAWLMPSLSVAEHFAVAFALVLLPAALSWHLVEKPALRFKSVPGEGGSPVVTRAVKP